MKGRVRTLAVVLAVVGISAAAVLGATATTNRSTSKQAAAAAHGKPPGPTNCGLRHNVKHVVYLIFDNVHFLRDNPNVPSDLEQMPHLLNFIRGNGTLLTNDHTVLISHTANGILTSLTGMYSDRHGQAVSNSYRYFKNDGSGLTNSSTSFKYWTDLTDDVNTPPTDANYNMVNADSGTNKNAPAPWVPYTRAGCDWGATALANVVLENTGTGPAGDMTKVFGSGSPEWNEAVASNGAPAGTPARNLAQTDFIGLAIHCAQTKKSICHDNPNTKSDQLPDEPGGYSGYQGLFGGKYVNPAICPANPSNCTNATANGQLALKKLDGTKITDQFDQPGFPGFDGLFASTTLSYVAQMQESGIPVTFGYTLAENLGTDFRELPINSAVDDFDSILAESFTGREPDLAEENLQARIRGVLLMALSNKFGWLVVATGNKSELSVGYATLYGDMAGGFALLKDVFKTDVFRLGRHLNERQGRELIPATIIERAPSAELRDDQLDEDSLPPYPALDRVLEAYVEQDRSREDLSEDGFDPDVVERALALIDRAEYKRRQAPPGVRLTPKAFGRDRRTPITNATAAAEARPAAPPAPASSRRGGSARG